MPFRARSIRDTHTHTHRHTRSYTKGVRLSGHFQPARCAAIGCKCDANFEDGEKRERSEREGQRERERERENRRNGAIRPATRERTGWRDKLEHRGAEAKPIGALRWMPAPEGGLPHPRIPATGPLTNLTTVVPRQPNRRRNIYLRGNCAAR